MAGKRHRDNLLQKMAVKVDQGTALTKHKCSASECNKSCTYLQRRILFHKQQILIGLLLVESNKASLKIRLGFIKEHFLSVKLEDKNGFICFTEYVCAHVNVKI